MNGRAAAAVCALLLTIGCAPRLLKLPTGPLAPASDARDAVADATAACHAVSSLSAEIAVSGSVGGRGFRGRLQGGVAKPASARLEAVAPFGAPIFILVVRGNDATLLLPRDDRVLQHGRPADVLEAVAGVPLDASDLLTTLTGCVVAPDLESGATVGGSNDSRDWRVVKDGPADVYVRRDPNAGRWHIVAVVRSGADGWRAEYKDFEDGLPRTIRLVSADPKRFDLRLSLSQVDVNPQLGPDVFRVDIPRSATPITLNELRDARPGVRKS